MHQHSYRHDLEDNLICGCAFVFARINAHRHTGPLDGFGRVVRLVLPPYFSTKPGSIETNPALVVEVPNVEYISI